MIKTYSTHKIYIIDINGTIILRELIIESLLLLLKNNTYTTINNVNIVTKYFKSKFKIFKLYTLVTDSVILFDITCVTPK